MDNNGWIKIHRKLLEWEWFDNPNMVRLWLYLLLNANFEDKKWCGIVIPKGSLLTSQTELSKNLKIPRQQLRTCLERLKSTNEITIKTTNENSIITICKYGSYQSDSNTEQPTNQPTNQPTTNQRLTNEQPTTNQPLIRRIKESKERKKEYEKSEISLSGNPTSNKTEIDFGKLIEFFNETTKGVFGTLKQPIGVTRRQMVQARIAEHGMETFKEVIRMALESDFLKGQNNSGWRASFDWLIKPTNFEKVLSGNYANHEKPQDHYKGDDTIGKVFERRGFND